MGHEHNYKESAYSQSSELGLKNEEEKKRWLLSLRAGTPVTNEGPGLLALTAVSLIPVVWPGQAGGCGGPGSEAVGSDSSRGRSSALALVGEPPVCRDISFLKYDSYCAFIVEQWDVC